MLNLQMPAEGWTHIHLDRTDSTLCDLRRPGVAALTTPFVLVTADYQTAGRGQRGTTWEADAGLNLLFGIRVCPTFLRPDGQFALSELTALAIAETLDEWVPDVRIKWPNDIYCGHRKICGMLLEHDVAGGRLSRTLIGPGININQAEFRGDAPNPVSLRQLLGHPVSREAVMNRLLARFARYYAALQHEGAAQRLHDAYVKRLYWRDGSLHDFADARGAFRARLDGVEPDGRLRLTDDAGVTRHYAFKEIRYLLCS